jgi:hypothetical protein
MDMKRKTCVIWNRKKFISRHITLPVRRNPYHRSLLTVVSAIPHLRFNLFFMNKAFITFLDPVVNRFTRQILPTVNSKYFLRIFFALSPFAHKKRTIERWSSAAQSPFWLLKSASEHAHERLLSRMSWSWAVLLPSENLLRPLQLFYSHLWPNYWLSLVVCPVPQLSSSVKKHLRSCGYHVHPSPFHLD